MTKVQAVQKLVSGRRTKVTNVQTWVGGQFLQRLSPAKAHPNVVICNRESVSRVAARSTRRGAEPDVHRLALRTTDLGHPDLDFGHQG